VVYSIGSHILGYNDKEIVGSEYFGLVPGIHREVHIKTDLLLNMFRTLELSSVFQSIGELYILDRAGYLVPINIK
jgi:hypothetical protein